jgi:hypothetical protein
MPDRDGLSSASFAVQRTMRRSLRILLPIVDRLDDHEALQEYRFDRREALRNRMEP